MKIVAVINQKGGVAKTTTTVNLGAALAAAGYRVLLVDLDPQGDMTDALNMTADGSAPSLTQALLGSYAGDPARLIVLHGEDGNPRMGVIPNTLEMFGLTRELDKMRAREYRLCHVLAPLAGMFDFCLLDCPPALDIITDNALTAADGVLIPAQPLDSSLRAVRHLLGQIAAVEQVLRQVPLDLYGIVVTMLEKGPEGKPKTLVARSVVASYEEMALPVLATVPVAVTAPESWRAGEGVETYAPGSEQAKAHRLLADALVKAVS